MAPPAKRRKVAIGANSSGESARGTRNIASFFSPKKAEQKATPSGSRSVSASPGKLAQSRTPRSSEADSDDRTEEQLRAQGLSSDAIFALKLNAIEAGLSLAAACATLGVEVCPQNNSPPEENGSNRMGKEPEVIDISGTVDIEYEDVLLEGEEQTAMQPIDGNSSKVDNKLCSPQSGYVAPLESKTPSTGKVHSAKTFPLLVQEKQNDPGTLDKTVDSIPLEEDIFLFDPYRDVDTSLWPPKSTPGSNSKAAPFGLLARAFFILSGTRSRLKIVTVLTNTLRVLRAHDPDAVLPAVYLVSNHIAPAYEGVELGLGGRTLSRVVANVTSASPTLMKQLWDRTGDPGDVAFEARKARGTRSLSFFGKPSASSILLVQGVFDSLKQIASSSGQGSASRKADVATRLLRSCRGEEMRFMARILSQHLRIQAVKTTIAVALARTFALVDNTSEDTQDNSWLITPSDRRGLRVVPFSHTEAKAKAANVHRARRGTTVVSEAASIWGSEETASEQLAHLKAKLLRAEQLVRRVFAQHPNFSDLVSALQSGGLTSLAEKVPLQVGTPIMPMLGSITRSLDDMFRRMRLGEPVSEEADEEQETTSSPLRAFVSEFKYDGQRVQVHAAFVPFQREGTGNTNGPDESFSERKHAFSDGPIGVERGMWVPVPGQGELWIRLFSRHLEDMTGKYPDITQMLPYLMGWQTQDGGELLPIAQRVTSLIFDAEIVAVSANRAESTRPFSSPADLEILPFQVLSNRSRKNVTLGDVQINIGVFAFDLMLLDGQSLLQTSLRHRRDLLHTRLPPLEVASEPKLARFAHVQSQISESKNGGTLDHDGVRAFFDLSRQSRCEGIMVKTLDSLWRLDQDGDSTEKPSAKPLSEEELGGPDLLLSSDTDQEDQDQPKTTRGKALLSTYEPDRRAESWLKVKKDYVEGVGDSLDLVPIGGWHGMGRKAAWWSPVLLAIYDPDTLTYTAVCKCISGFSDDEYKRVLETFTTAKGTAWDPRAEGTVKGSGMLRPPHAEPNSRTDHEEEEFTYDLGNMSVPDILFRPREVWEVRSAELSLSPVYTAAQEVTGTERGLSLRFPRFMRVRHDRSPIQASTAGDLARLWMGKM